MNMTTAIAKGFMRGKITLRQVLQGTVDFLERKLTKNEYNQIVKAYKKYLSEYFFMNGEEIKQ